MRNLQAKACEKTIKVDRLNGQRKCFPQKRKLPTKKTKHGNWAYAPHPPRTCLPRPSQLVVKALELFEAIKIKNTSWYGEEVVIDGGIVSTPFIKKLFLRQSSLYE